MKKHKSKRKTDEKSKGDIVSEPFDEAAVHMFSAKVNLGPNVDVDIDFEVKSPTEKDSHLSIDDVDFAIHRILDEKYPEEFFPKADVVSLWIYENGRKYRVVGESNKDEIDRLKKAGEKFLVLPECTYVLHPNYALFLKMQELGLIEEDEEYDAETMGQLVEAVENCID